MKRLLIVLLSLSAFAFAFAEEPAPAVVFTTRRAIPAVAFTLYADDGVRIFGGYPSVEALFGYDAEPETAALGYAAVLNWRVTERTSFFAGAGYLAPIREVSFREAGDNLGVVFGARLRF